MTSKRSKPGPKGSHEQREERLLQVSRLYLRGHNQGEIANRLGISQAMVSLDLALLEERRRAEPTNNIAAAIAIERARIDQLAAEFWDGWERSLRPVEGAVGEQEENSKGNSKANASVEVQVPSRCAKPGNVAFLAGVERCIAMRLRLLGVPSSVVSERGYAEVSRGGVASESPWSNFGNPDQGPLPGFKTLAKRLSERLGVMSPGDRTRNIERLGGIFREVEKLNYELFQIPFTRPDDAEAFAKEQAERDAARPPRNLVVRDGEAVYLDENEVEGQ